MVCVYNVLLLAPLYQAVQVFIHIGGTFNHIVVDGQVVACPVSRQQITVGIHQIAPDALYPGKGGKGGGIVFTAASFNDLQIIKMRAEKEHHRNKQQNHNTAAESGYSFHISPPIFPMSLHTGYSTGTAIQDRIPVRKNTPKRPP